MFRRGRNTDEPLYTANDVLEEFAKIDDAAADDPTLQMLGFDYLLSATTDNDHAATHLQAAQTSFACQQLMVFRTEMIGAARRMGIDVRDLKAFQTGAVKDELISRMVVQLAYRALERRLGMRDSAFAGVIGSRLVH